MAEGGARRSERKRAKSFKAELIAASEQKSKGSRRGKSSVGQVAETDSGPEEKRGWSEGSCDLEEVGVVSGESEEGRDVGGEVIRRSARKRKQIEVFDPSSGLGDLLSAKRVTRVQEQAAGVDPLVHGAPVQPKWVGPVRDARRMVPSSGQTSSDEKPPKMAAKTKTVRHLRQKLQHQISDSSGACSEGNVDSEGRSPSPVPEGGESGEGCVGVPTEGCWSHFEELCAVLPGRRTQVELLLTLWGEVRTEDIHL